MHGLCAQEEAPLRRSGTTHQLQRLAERRLGRPGRVHAVRAATLGRQPVGGGDCLHEGGLARTVLPDEEGHDRSEVEPLGEHLRDRGDRGGVAPRPDLVPGARLDAAYGMTRDVPTPQRHGDNRATTGPGHPGRRIRLTF